MELTPEMKKALEEQKANCPFCKIIKGDIPATKVFEDEKVIAILDINPLVEGHTLLMLKEHYPILPYLSKEEFDYQFKIMQDIIFALQKSLLKSGCNVFIANGAAAGQNSPHFMVHLIPREKGDNLTLFNMDGKEEHDKKVFEIISQNLTYLMDNHFKKYPVEWYKPKDIKQKFSKEQVIEIIDNNPSLKKIIMEDPEALIKEYQNNEQLKSLFSDVDIQEIIKHFKKDYQPEKEAEIIEDKETEKNEDKPDLDKISKMFK